MRLKAIIELGYTGALSIDDKGVINWYGAEPAFTDQEINDKVVLLEAEKIAQAEAKVLSDELDELASATNKHYIQSFTANKTIVTGNSQSINLFSEVTIQANKNVKLSMYVPTRSDHNAWGGLYINTNIRVNGAWYNLGHSGYDGGTMVNGSTIISTYDNNKILNIIDNCGLTERESFTFQVELRGSSNAGNVLINQNHNINATGKNLHVRGTMQTWGSNQNYCTLMIEETSRN